MVSTAWLEASGQQPDTEPSARQHQALRRARHTVLLRFGILKQDNGPPSASAAAAAKSSAPAPRPWWRRTQAVHVALGIHQVLRYPIQTATMYRQVHGQQPPVLVSWRQLSEMPLGALYLWLRGTHLGAIGLGVRAIAPWLDAHRSLGLTSLGMTLHYCCFGLLYGLWRQTVVSRLRAAAAPHEPSPGWRALLAPALHWARARLLLQGPSGAVLYTYLRDLAGSALRHALTGAFTHLLSSPTAIRAYAAVGRAQRRLSPTPSPTPPPALLQPETLRGRQRQRQRRRRRESSDVEVVFSDEHTSPGDILGSHGELLVYMQAVSGLLAELTARAVLYPLTTVVVRLMADETGVTRMGYRGFVDCVRRSPLSLYEGFGWATVAESALVWTAAEIAHYLCKSAWLITQ
ncbi:hypothetical protein GGI07_005797 [Coemansia sp. Benny D115]|nr:hypothetical protein GGI07_005797 [Coemansia sp. Benny D115]